MFKNGDVVVVTGSHSPNEAGYMTGKIGVVRYVTKTKIGVEFGHDFHGHHLDGVILSPRGWFFNPQALTILEPVNKVIKTYFFGEDHAFCERPVISGIEKDGFF